METKTINEQRKWNKDHFRNGRNFQFFVKGMMKKLLGSTEMKSGLLLKMKRKERERKK